MCSWYQVVSTGCLWELQLIQVLPFIFICKSVPTCRKYCCHSFPALLPFHLSLPLTTAQSDCSAPRSDFTAAFYMHLWKIHPPTSFTGWERPVGWLLVEGGKSWTLILCTCPWFTSADVWAPQALAGAVARLTPKGCTSQEDFQLGIALLRASSCSYCLCRALGSPLFCQSRPRLHLWSFDSVYIQSILISTVFLYSRQILIHIWLSFPLSVTLFLRFVCRSFYGSFTKELVFQTDILSLQIPKKIVCFMVLLLMLIASAIKENTTGKKKLKCLWIPKSRISASHYREAN